MRKSIVAVAFTAAASLLVAGVAPATAATSAEDKGVTLAKAIVAKYNKTPANIGITTPLKKTPPKGKFVVMLSNGGDENKVLDEGIAAAAKTLGWKSKELVGAVTPETQRSLFSQALSLKPDYIHISGIEPSTLSDLLVKADKQGVVVVCSACMSKPVAALKDTHIAGPKMLDLWGQMIAAYTVASTNGNAKVQGVTVPLYPILIRFDQSYEKNLKRLCPSKCTYEANPQQLTDIFAGKTPQAVVNIVASNPGTNWIVSDLGGWVTGVASALDNPAIQIGGLTAGKANIQGVKDGTESAWTGYSLPIVGWSVVDSFARDSVGQPFVTNDLPTQILTKQNAKTLVLTPAGDYLGVKNYVNEFKLLWRVK
jgi:ribose transport system substrate-binding protein